MDSSESVSRLIKIVRKGLADPTRGAFLWVGSGLSIPAGYPSLGNLAEMPRNESLEGLPENLTPHSPGAVELIEGGLKELDEAFRRRR